MVITLQLTAEQERQLEEGAARKDAATVREVLVQAIDDTVPRLLETPQQQLSAAELESLLDSIAADFPDLPSLPEEALTREGIYGDHP